MATLLLFDIDGTLLETAGSGGAALLDAAEEVLQVSRELLPPLDLAGATDSGVIRKLFTQAGHGQEPQRVDAFLASYLGHLERRLKGAEFRGRLFPGVVELLEELAKRPGVDLGLLTGNVRRGAELKLGRFGLNAYFLDGAFGDDEEDRNLLGPVALRRLATTTGRSYTPEEVVVIGDTPKDIACAAAMGARCLAVGTGVFGVDQLRAHSPWLVLDDLAQTQAVCELLAGAGTF